MDGLLRNLLYLSYGVYLLLNSTTIRAQTIPAGSTLVEDAIRRNELKGLYKELNTSMIRPVKTVLRSNYDSLMYQATGILPTSALPLLKRKGSWRLLPASLQQQYNTHHSFGWNDGSLYPANGYQLRATAGIYAELGLFSLQLQPEFIVAENKSSPGFSRAQSDSAWYYYYEFLNSIDKPEQFGRGSISKLFPGQSSLRINYAGMSLGLSSENLWWGPGTRNALIMSNNAPGFYHLTFNSTRPHKTFLGKFEWQLIAGRLENSGILPPDTNRLFEGAPLYQPKPAANRYINAMVVNWQPKWVNGLELGFIRSFFQYANTIQPGLNGYLPVFTAFFKGNARDENSFGRDQLLSFYFRWIFEKEQAEIYGEWGRNDHAGNLTDFLQEPEHSRAYIIGIRKLFTRDRKKDLEFFTELTHLQVPGTVMLRALQPWYAHYQVRHGYTHQGQVLGAGIGPGSSSQSIGLNWHYENKTRFRLLFERIVRNNDFYYKAFNNTGNFNSHWVDLVLHGAKTWQQKRWLITANISVIRSFNYQWRHKEQPATLDNQKENINHAQVGLNFGYLF
ncbi:capsule assembly Wzi family protein [Flavihumibacter sp. CACIAM 22H1]|uniref:capsule assembly Wzi family protein n=1 Tax=Flavihumibacter sp. CACIAM 22H1 TaxID=1812911 RepID=UPI0007A92D31|nr:capsule assembly Wzi family protein [Flavihumibacter sp. CACIAM 22H1]KYP15970.1 MAG: hypothetical protein A1D16_06830 [Flavihumibacter sp. CACIAM 22H1]